MENVSSKHANILILDQLIQARNKTEGEEHHGLLLMTAFGLITGEYLDQPVIDVSLSVEFTELNQELNARGINRYESLSLLKQNCILNDSPVPIVDNGDGSFLTLFNVRIYKEKFSDKPILITNIFYLHLDSIIGFMSLPLASRG